MLLSLFSISLYEFCLDLDEYGYEVEEVDLEDDLVDEEDLVVVEDDHDEDEQGISPMQKLCCPSYTHALIYVYIPIL